MQPDVKISMTIHPEVSHDLMEKTFEGHLLAHIIRPMRTGTGYELRAPNGVSPVFSDLPNLLEKALESDGDLADRMVPVLARAIAEDRGPYDATLGFDELSEALGEDFDLETVLQEVCRLHPETHPFFQVLWATHLDDASRQFADHGMVGGGAQIVTATGVETMDVRNWLDSRTAEIRKSIALTSVKDEFEFRGTTVRNGHWYIDLPEVDWNRVARGEAAHQLRIGQASQGEYRLQKVEGEDIEPVDVFETLEKAKSMALNLVKYREIRQEGRLLESVELVPTSWKIRWEEGVPVAALRSDPTVTIRADGAEDWTLRAGDDVLATERTAADLHPFLLKFVEGRKPI